jgi:hypothetical protein
MTREAMARAAAPARATAIRVRTEPVRNARVGGAPRWAGIASAATADSPTAAAIDNQNSSNRAVSVIR